MKSGYTLVVCEKPDAARRVADALSGGKARAFDVKGTTAFRLERGGEELVIYSAQGHVFSVSDPLDERVVHPVFDVEWYSSDLVDEHGAGAARRVAAFKDLAEGASKFVNACDFDVEGETIGYNVLRYACGGKEVGAARAKFSTLTEGDLIAAFEKASPRTVDAPALAGRARHILDFFWGINFSRALSRSALSAGGRYSTVSMGRVQGPTLGFLVERELEVRQFVPVPFWKVSGRFLGPGGEFSAGHSTERIQTLDEAERVRKDCLGKEGVAVKLARKVSEVPPPPPFNLGELQKEAYKNFRIPPTRTAQAAERLYLMALTSYPRTGSQRLPPSIGYARIMRGLGTMREYSKDAGELLSKALRPVQGPGFDPAHPAIHPTGMKPKVPLRGQEASVFDLVVRRFLAAFGRPARREAAEGTVAVGRHSFTVSGARTVFMGWAEMYGKYARFRDVEIPAMRQGDRFKVLGITSEQRLDPPPRRFDQATLLEKMEKERIGTKATRAETISTLIDRGYVSGEKLQVTDVGLAVVETMAKFAPPMVTTGLTRSVEEKLAAIEESGGGDAELVRDAVRSICGQLLELKENEADVGERLGRALTSSAPSAEVLGPCPVCKSGQLRVVRSKLTKKRFAGCSNYPKGCKASSPLPQKGTIKSTGKACRHCSWPEVLVTGGRRPWRLCVNISCPGKAAVKR